MSEALYDQRLPPGRPMPSQVCVTAARYCLRCGIMPDLADLNKIMLETRINA